MLLNCIRLTFLLQTFSNIYTFVGLTCLTFRNIQQTFVKARRVQILLRLQVMLAHAYLYYLNLHNVINALPDFNDNFFQQTNFTSFLNCM